jgi:hypothetical protein
MMKAPFSILLSLVFSGISVLQGQGTLQFNQVRVLDASSPTYTVPAGKVWKIENISTNRSIYATPPSANFNTTWSAGGTNPCTGASSGTSNVQQLNFSVCRSFPSEFTINGVRHNFITNAPVWLPAGATLQLYGTFCNHTATVSVPAGVPYYDNYYGAYLCGPVSYTASTPVTNSILVSLIEFNVIP